jgi:hypothetical protein
MMRDAQGADAVAILQRYNAWRRGENLSLQAPARVGEAIDAILAEVTRLRAVEAAARNLLAARGTKTLVAYNALAEALQ